MQAKQITIIAISISAIAYAIIAVYTRPDTPLADTTEVDLEHTQHSESIVENDTFGDNLHAALIAQDRAVSLRYLAQAEDGALAHISAMSERYDFEFLQALLLSHFKSKSNWSNALSRVSISDLNTELKEPLILSLIAEVAIEDYASVLNWISENHDQGIAVSALSTLGKMAGASETPANYLNWIEPYLLTDQLQSTFYKSFFGEWTRHDIEASLSALNALPSSPVLDGAIHDFVMNTGSMIDPAETMTWAESVHNFKMRKSAINKAAEMMILRDTEDYRLWRLQAQLPPEIENHLP
ncbi:MAG: hypothetical protein ACSHYA_04360 [Opitutaceae bacterium]